MGRFTLGLGEAAAFFGSKDDLGINLQERDKRIVYTVRIAVNRFVFLHSGWVEMSCRRGRLEAIRCQGRTVDRERHGAQLDGNSAKRLVASMI